MKKMDEDNRNKLKALLDEDISSCLMVTDEKTAICGTNRNILKNFCDLTEKLIGEYGKETILRMFALSVTAFDARKNEEKYSDQEEFDELYEKMQDFIKELLGD